MHDQPHLGFHNGRVEPIEDRWERMIAGTPWVASCTVAVDADEVETCSGPEAGGRDSSASEVIVSAPRAASSRTSVASSAERE